MVKILIYGFPVILMIIEFILRASLALDTQIFIGPTLASVGIGFVIPLVAPKEKNFGLTDKKIKEYQTKGIVLRSTRDETFIHFVLILIFVFTISWMSSLYLSSQFPKMTWLTVPAYMYPGFLNYFGGVLLSVVKGVI
ncbi:MAG: hypothetical protein GY797_34760 [Deltaproteobacteria bacterium]|nr:hypothetical protein [Deltaproteobacteria bacterium]